MKQWGGLRVALFAPISTGQGLLRSVRQSKVGVVDHRWRATTPAHRWTLATCDRSVARSESTPITRVAGTAVSYQPLIEKATHL